MDPLMRRCERKTNWRKAACCLFWTLGGNQVGRAAIGGWRDVIVPALQEDGVHVWPFDGSIDDLLKAGKLVIAETYPAEYYRHFLEELPHGFGKRNQEHRQVVGQALTYFAGDMGILMDEDLRIKLLNGFGDQRGADDPFDATVGLFGMLEVVLGRRTSGEPEERVISTLEGWILGLTPI